MPNFQPKAPVSGTRRYELLGPVLCPPRRASWKGVGSVTLTAREPRGQWHTCQRRAWHAPSPEKVLGRSPGASERPQAGADPPLPPASQCRSTRKIHHDCSAYVYILFVKIKYVVPVHIYFATEVPRIVEPYLINSNEAHVSSLRVKSFQRHFLIIRQSS